MHNLVTVDVDDTSHLAATLLLEIPGTGNVPWYMNDSIAAEDGYSEVVVSVSWSDSSYRWCRETTQDDQE